MRQQGNTQSCHNPLMTDAVAAPIPGGAPSYLKESWGRFKTMRSAYWGLIFLALLIVCALIIPYLSSHVDYKVAPHLKNNPPSKQFWFGTDALGRDLFVRVWWGARISLLVGLTAALIDIIVGVMLGACAGLKGGKTDQLLMRLADVFSSLPRMLIVVVLAMMLGSGLHSVIIAISLTGWTNMARIMRAQVLQVKQLDFVKASSLFGSSQWGLLIRHLIPNSIGSIITTMTLTVPYAIFSEAFLSFVGLGVQLPSSSWGVMVNEGVQALSYYPWRLLFPATFISATMLAFNLVGDGVREAFDPYMRK